MTRQPLMIMTVPPKDRSLLSPDLYTSSLDRQLLYASASSVASILRSLGPSKAEKKQGAEIISAYIQSKRERGKSTAEIMDKLVKLEEKVCVEKVPMPRDVFVRAKLQTGLTPSPSPSSSPSSSSPSIPHHTPPKVKHAPKPLQQPKPKPEPSPSPSSSESDETFFPSTATEYSAPNSSRGTTLDLSPSSSLPLFSAALPETPTTDSTSFSFSLSLSFLAPASPSLGIGSDDGTSPDAESGWSDRDRSWYSDSSFSAPCPASRHRMPHNMELEPLGPADRNPSNSTSNCSAEPAATPKQNNDNGIDEDHDAHSAISSTYGGYPARVPTLLSPLALGGWGREWERRYLHRQSVLGGISLDSFPAPPARGARQQKQQEQEQDEKHLFDGFDLGEKILRSGDGPNKANDGWNGWKDPGINSSWLSLEGCLSPQSQGDEDQWGFGLGGGEENDNGDEGDEDGDENTITGPTSSRWSAVCSESSFGDLPLSARPRAGPTEASLIRDAYLKGITAGQAPAPAPAPTPVYSSSYDYNDSSSISVATSQSTLA